VGEYEWRRAQSSQLVEVTDQVEVTAPASVKMIAWRQFAVEWKPFLQEIDLSGLVVELLPEGATLEGLVWLERAVLPTRMRVLPRDFFRRCWRLSSIDSGRAALEEIWEEACEGCRSLTAFAFPPTLRVVGAHAFSGTSITNIDLSGTMAESFDGCYMTFLVDLVLPRRCILAPNWDIDGMPCLRRVTFGVSHDGGFFGWHPTLVRFESLAAGNGFSPGLLDARVYGEVACELGRETIPFPPP
jgi:hypothetical protein